MTDQAFDESGMTFGPFPPGHCFRIEKSATLQALGARVKTAEFVLLRSEPPKPPAIWIVEAKSSSPHPKNHADFSQFIADVCDKLVNSVALAAAMRLGRHPQTAAEVPRPLADFDLPQVATALVLVVNGHPIEWLQELTDRLNLQFNSKLGVQKKIWAFDADPVIVLNDSLARKHGLIA